MRYTNINILSEDRRFRYVVEYQDDVEQVASKDLGYEVSDGRIDFSTSDLKREGNDWVDYTSKHLSHDYVPENYYNISSINFYYPEYSIETYEQDVNYALTINTWIHGKYIYLGTFILNRKDAIACNRVREFEGTRYYEFTNIRIIDPWYLTYGDEWRGFRRNVCGEEEFDDCEINGTGSILNISLHPIEEVGSRYIKLRDYIGGQNAINLSDNITGYISYHIGREEYYGYEERIHGSLSFNKSYEQNYEGLKLYLKETYNIDNFILRYEFVVKDKENIYKTCQFIKEDIHCTITRDDLRFDSWDDFIEGMSIAASVDIIIDSEDSDDYEEVYPTLSIISNELPLTQDLFKFYIGELPFNHVTLSLIDMNTYNINTVNKIEKKIIQVDRPSDYKSNILKPVYYKVKDVASIVLHPAVTENICLNLDAYKSSVEAFIIQVEGVNFTERARTNAGVIFKIVGTSLPNINTSGVYYILNQDSELITTGKYNYEV